VELHHFAGTKQIHHSDERRAAACLAEENRSRSQVRDTTHSKGAEGRYWIDSKETGMSGCL